MRDDTIICRCEEVTWGEVKAALEAGLRDPGDLRKYTRIGMGTCQGELCACRAAGLLAKAHGCADRARTDLVKFMNERWKGMYPVAWGDTLREAEFTAWVYSECLGTDAVAENKKTEDK